MVLGVRHFAKAIPTNPQSCIMFHWTGGPGARSLDVPMAAVRYQAMVKQGRGRKRHTVMVDTLDVISSNSPAGVMRRFETWLNRKIGKSPREWIGRPVTLEVMGEKAITLEVREVSISRSILDPEWACQCKVRLWWLDREFDDLHGTWTTCFLRMNLK